jgi:hypothetical protein
MFSITIVFDSKIEFYSAIRKPIEECNKVYKYVQNPKHALQQISFPFINGNLNMSFNELSKYIDVDYDFDTNWHGRRCPCCNHIDTFVATYIYDYILDKVKDDEKAYLIGVKKLFD